MAVVAELTVSINGKDAGVDAMLARLEARLKALDKQGQQAGAGMGAGIGRGARQASDGTLALAQAQARLLSTTGQNQAAYTSLSGAIGGSTGNVLQLTRAKTQLAQIQNRLSGQSQTLTSLFGQQRNAIAGLGAQLSQLGGSAGALSGSIGQLAGSFGTLGAIGAAIGIGKAVVDFSVAGAGADLLRQRFDSLAVAAGTTGEALITALRGASGGEISDLNLTLAANKAQLLGVADTAEEFGVLMGIARDRAQQMGISTTQAFNDLTTGLGRGSALILDNLGIILSVKEANETYATSIGKTVSALTEAEQKQALINAVLAQGKASLDATGGAVDMAAGTYQRFGTNVANATSSIGSFLSGGLEPLAAQANATVDATGQLIQFFEQIGPSASVAAAGMDAYRNAIQHGATEAAAQIAAEQARAAALAATSGVAQVATDIEQLRVNAMNAAAAITLQATTASLGYADSLELSGVMARAAALAAQLKAGADQVAAVDAQTHALAQQKLADAAERAANVLIAAGPAGARTAAILAGSSSQVDQLTAAFYRLAAAKEVAAVKDPMGGVSEGRGERDTQADRALVKSNQALEANRALLASIAALNNPPKGGGGGSPRLTDQAKLNNSLLASQEQFDTKSEDAERAHLDKILSINADFAEKMKDAQADFGQSRLDSDVSFYSSLRSITDHGLQVAMADQYEAALTEAEKIAQEKGADVADAFLKAKEETIKAQGQRAQEIADAEKEGKTDEAEFLRGIDAKAKKAEDARLARAIEGEGSIAAERTAALADETAKNDAAMEKIGTAAERAEARAVTAAERRGAAIDAEKLKVDGVANSYDRIGAAAARAGITPSPVGVAGPTGVPAVPTAASAAAADPIALAMEGIRAGLDALERATREAGRGVEGAVGRLSGKFAS